MARRKRKKTADSHMDESWLIPYADILTLLLALFIVLFSMSSVDAVKFQQLSKAFNDIFTGGTGVMEHSSVNPEGRNDSESTLEENLQQGSLGAKDYKELSELQERIDEYITQNDMEEKLDTTLTGEGLLVTIRDNVLFESGSASIRSEDLQIANEIASLFVMDPPRSIVISGHTDNVPIATFQFSSNWDLSVMRAVNFMKILLENDALNPEWFSAKGYGEFKPVASNDTAEGRAQNRRVEILIAPRTQVDL
ncbi:MAG: flagellar motor protein MotB [Bacillus sp. (in: firmicutes)]